MEQEKRIAFIRPKAWPLANSIVEGVLEEQFPGYEVDVIDIFKMVRKRPGLILVNSIATTLHYGKDIVLGRKKFKLAFWRTPFIFRQIKRLVREKIAAETYAFSFQMQSLFDASVPGVPHFIYTDHTHLENRHYSTNGGYNLYSTHWISLEREIYKNATLVFVRSSNVQRSLLDVYDCPVRKVARVHAGSNATVSHRKNINIDYTKPEILFVGLDWKRKGGPDLVEAFKIVSEKCPEAKLTIVGAQPDIQVPNCEVVGKVAPAELDQYYQRASVFCLPTHLEPFGIAFIEAMTAHLPIVATRIGAIPDFVEEGENGWLVQPGDVPGIAAALLKLLQNPEQSRAFGKYSYQLTQDRYSWNAVGKKFRESILTVLNQSMPPSSEMTWRSQEMQS